MDHRIRPRVIAQKYIEGKSIEWVKAECKRYDNPEAVFKWVGSYIKGARNENAGNPKQSLRASKGANRKRL